MDREQLIGQVKNEYSRLASQHSRQHIVENIADISPNAYYEKILNEVIDEISVGRFDNFNSGSQIVNAVATNKEKWIPNWTN